MRTCDYCGGEVSDTAKKCKHCGEWLNRDTKQQETVQKEVNNFQNTKEENFNNSTDIQTNSQANTKTQDSYLLIILIGIVVLMIAIIALFLFQDKINNLKGNEIEKIIKNANEKVFGYESAGIENTIYKLMENDYNQIVYFKDKNTGADTYAFRVQTDFKNNSESNDTFNYELGRIIINPNDINKSKYTYNYRSGEDGNPIKWFAGSDKTFVKSIPQIAKLKNEAYLRYKNNEYLSLINLYSECTALDAEGLYEQKCETLPQDSGELLDGWYRGSHEALAKLRSTTL